MFEQSVLPDTRSQRPQMFLLVTAAEVLLLATAIVVPLFLIGGPEIPKLPPLVKFHPRSMPIDVVPVTHIERLSTHNPVLSAILTAPIRIPTTTPRINDLDDHQAPEIPFVQSSGGPVPFATGNENRATPDPPPPPKPAKTEPPAKPLQPIHVSQGVQEAKLVHRVVPIYPKLAIQTRQFGTVQMVAVIGKDGHMRNIQVLSGAPFLVAAALEAVKQWVYKPTLLNGEPVEVVAPITVNFTLSQ